MKKILNNVSIKKIKKWQVSQRNLPFPNSNASNQYLDNPTKKNKRNVRKRFYLKNKKMASFGMKLTISTPN